MTIASTHLSMSDVRRLLELQESHFADFKAREVAPASLTKHIAAFANSDGGELYIGIDETPAGREWRGFDAIEDANGMVHAFEQVIPLGQHFTLEFLTHDGCRGHVLHANVARTPFIAKSSDGTVYVRRSAHKVPLRDPESLRRLELDKGVYSFESDTLDIPLDF